MLFASDIVPGWWYRWQMTDHRSSARTTNGAVDCGGGIRFKMRTVQCEKVCMSKESAMTNLKRALCIICKQFGKEKSQIMLWTSVMLTTVQAIPDAGMDLVCIMKMK